MRRLSLLSLLLFAPAFFSPAHAEDRALVIGINHYPDITLNGVPGQRDLRGAVPDAKSFANFLTKDFGLKSNQVELLLDGDATREGIVKAFQEWLVDGTRPGDRAILYYAGHGAQIEDTNGDEPPGDLYDEALAPADSAGELTTSPVSLRNLLIDDDIGLLLGKLAGRRVQVFVDACFSGTITRGIDTALAENSDIRTRTLTPRSPATSRGLKIIPNEARKQHKVATILFDTISEGDTSNANSVQDGESEIVWTATSSSQEAFDKSNGGVFTQSFLEAVRDKRADTDHDGKVTAAEALKYVQAESESTCKSLPNFCLSGLTPTLEAPAAYYSQVLAPYADELSTPAEEPSRKVPSFFAHQNDFAVEVDILPSTQLSYGEEVVFRATTDVDAQLILLDQSPDGSITQIFPNKFAQGDAGRGFVRAGAPLKIPDPYYGFRFTATEKGKSKLIALAVEPGTNLSGILDPVGNLDRIADANAFLNRLAKALLEPVITTDEYQPNRRRHWGFAYKEYDVK